ncbi:CDP-glycerol glycerophosphotransferase family protein [Lactococcus garvieae]|uniref:CDP-glycerol glycerophosphotransferase family protein n=1 Tax=Lactococcus garvieae TaxID=1363 RepID=UPI000266E6C4|nr:CDP-glycerol glycerophosphotransferase family protein [Lactococcus garvieae]MDN5629708.1 CDP-glycerol glycerophosphotransferase family protein [Lactococcus sp.]EIT65940.1 Teichoic acid biosynthesis protein B [Lactococcus garvieae IPLA 31405]MBS4464086.1 CDP-glycerol glycerophosphotransferase family protein [Lactococcus garvieae]MCO7128476.1 CDP-glycerol glycerophosphotransferase family protein [Lactococcus garvieae]MDB7634931.1 CDP-glycerol glycerophosphotransferase family protein [Lactococ
MKLKSIVLTIILALFYPFTFLFRVHQNRITFISLEHDNLSKDFKILHDELSAKQEYEIKTLLFKFQPTFLGQLQYGLACIQQLFVLQSSKLVIIDYNNFVISKFLHRKEVKVLEIWHATAALKNFGNCVQRDYEIKNYDYAIANSDFYKGVYAQAFNLPEENVLVTGIPNNDKIFDDHFVQDTKVRLLEKYPVLANKKVITYAPTFRGRISTYFKEAKIDLARVHQALGEDYVIIYKAHPLISGSAYENNPHVLFIEEEPISSIFCITDVLITDYSAIAVDWMVFDKPIISYVPDFKSYSKKPGLTIDYLQEFPGAVTFNEGELIQALQATDSTSYQKERALFFKKTYNYCDGKATERVLKVIEDLMTEKTVEKNMREVEI